ncbi:MAG: hypothetical protein GY931_11175 [Maribacter sp.]|nr:hypothetical protein [Maribacter sp.]
MKAITSILVFTLFIGSSIELTQIRETFPLAANNEEITKKLFDDLLFVTNKEKEIFIAYKGAVSTLMAKYTTKAKEKKEFFKVGVEFLEYALIKDPNNIEIRCLRLSVQENSPKFLKYRANIEEDKRFILDHYSSITLKEVQNMVKNYVLQSSLFDRSEKQLF